MNGSIVTTRRRLLRTAEACSLVLLPALTLWAAPAERALSGKLSEKVRLQSEGQGSKPVDVLVRFRQPPDAGKRALVTGLGGRVGRQFTASRWMAAQLPARAVAQLANRPDVEFVASDAPTFASMDVAREAADAPGPAEPEASLTGAGVTIAMLDSGVAPHPAITTLVTAVDALGQDPPLVLPETVDPNGHGTHVAGILVGDGASSQGGRLHGLAPQAGLVSVRVLDGDGRGKTSDVLAGLHWVIDHKDELGVRVLNLSLGHPVYEPAELDPLVQAAEAAWDAGIVVVCSAGNWGTSGHGSIASPCNSRKVITVGALNAWHTGDTADDSVTTYSSRGPTRGDLVAKPDLLAPGNRIVSTRAPGSHLDLLYPERRVADDPEHPELVDYFELSGTSMAAPMVSGAAALMLEQEPGLNPATVKARLMLTATKAAAADPFTTGAGGLDILAALRTTGYVGAAPSPVVVADPASSGVEVENTATLWADPAFPISTLWSGAVQWVGDPTQGVVVVTDAVLWPDLSAGPYSLLWPSDLPPAQAWDETPLWAEAVLWPDAAPPEIIIEGQGGLVEDP